MLILYLEKDDKNAAGPSDASVRARQPKMCRSDIFINVINYK